MAKRKYSSEEVEQYRKEHGQIFYFNRDDSNFFVHKRYGIGYSFNFAHPGMILVAIALIVLILFKI